ncbi:MAG TPA: glycosyltransferase family 4 protein [Candidatus Eremiobacteraeota bacterium]|nr:glycosyltransferase family 4 protein [Candidatus Eremiobacteraeota bacterium]
MKIDEVKPLQIISGIYSPFDRFNGSVVFCHNLYEEMIKKGCNINFIALKTKDPLETSMKLTLLEGTLTGEADTPAFNKAVQDMKEAFQKILNNNPIDIVHCQHMTFPPAVAFASMKVKQPLVITSHASDIEFAKNNPIHAAYVRKSLDMADKVVLLSRKLIPLIEEIKPDMAFEKIAIIPLGVDEKFFISEKPLKEKDTFTILYSGRLTKEKGVEILFDALRELPRTLLRIAGKGSYEEYLQNKAKDMHLEERINFLGFLGKKELKKEYQKADILVIPSQGIEGIPQVCLEGMANYLPVIATDSGGISEAVDDSALVVTRGKPEEIIKAIIKLYKDPLLREELALKGRERVEQFRWERISHLYLALFRSLL